MKKQEEIMSLIETDRVLKIENAKIKNAILGFEDHGILTLELPLEGDGWGTYFGGFRMDGANGMECVKDLLNTMKIGSLDALSNTYCRTISDGLGGRVRAIGHLIEDRWFSFEVFFRENPF